jgi:hypothetical protein
MADQLQKLGTKDFPTAWRRIWERELLDSKKSDRDDHVDESDALPYQEPGTTFAEQVSQLETEFDSSIQDCRVTRRGLPTFGEAEKRAILNLMTAMLSFDPKHRWDIEQALASEWMQHWALPALQGPGFSVWPCNYHVGARRRRQFKLFHKLEG